MSWINFFSRRFPFQSDKKTYYSFSIRERREHKQTRLHFFTVAHEKSIQLKGTADIHLPHGSSAASFTEIEKATKSITKRQKKNVFELCTFRRSFPQQFCDARARKGDRNVMRQEKVFSFKVINLAHGPGSLLYEHTRIVFGELRYDRTEDKNKAPEILH